MNVKAKKLAEDGLRPTKDFHRLIKKFDVPNKNCVTGGKLEVIFNRDGT